jgi:radical SAM protein (TIGR01212 family)
MNRLYYKYSDYLENKYGEKVYKIPLNIPSGCPNRDGSKGYSGCIFCAPDGAGHENMPSDVCIYDQYEAMRQLLIKKYKAKKYIAYFQSNSNTYIQNNKFEYYMKKAAQLPGCVALAISTRADCVRQFHIDTLSEIKENYCVDICVELGLQSSNDNTLEILNRHHTVADVIKASEMIKNAGFELCLHIIADLIWDGKEDILNDAKIINQVKADSIKVHSLYIAKETELERMYRRGEVSLLSLDEYIDRVILLFENLNKNTAIQRLVSRVTEHKSVVCTWGRSWRKVLEMIEAEMTKRGSLQGKNIKKM